MTHVTRSEVLVDWRKTTEVRVMRQKACPYQLEQFVQRGPGMHRHVENGVQCRRVRGRGSKQVGLNDVGHVTEIAASFTISIDVNGFILDHRRDPLGNDRGVSAIGILAWPEHVEVAEANSFQTIALREDARVNFVGKLGGGDIKYLFLFK